MSSISAPLGLRPAYHPSGCIRQRQTPNIDQSVAFLQFQPVGINVAAGTLVPVAGAAITAAPNDFVGVFMGVEFTGTDGRRRVANQWVANTAILTGSDLVAYYTRDPEIVYEIQAAGTLTAAAIGNQFTYTNPTPGTQEEITGLWQGQLVTTPASGTEQGALKIVGLNPGPDNVFGDAFPVVQVIINAHQDRPGRNFAGTPA